MTSLPWQENTRNHARLHYFKRTHAHTVARFLLSSCSHHMLHCLSHTGDTMPVSNEGGVKSNIQRSVNLGKGWGPSHHLPHVRLAEGDQDQTMHYHISRAERFTGGGCLKSCEASFSESCRQGRVAGVMRQRHEQLVAITLTAMDNERTTTVAGSLKQPIAPKCNWAVLVPACMLTCWRG